MILSTLVTSTVNLIVALIITNYLVSFPTSWKVGFNTCILPLNGGGFIKIRLLVGMIQLTTNVCSTESTSNVSK